MEKERRHEEILGRIMEEIVGMVRGLLERLILEERRRVSYELSEAIPAMYASGLSTGDIARVLETLYGAFYSPQNIS